MVLNLQAGSENMNQLVMENILHCELSIKVDTGRIELYNNYRPRQFKFTRLDQNQLVAPLAILSPH